MAELTPKQAQFVAEYLVDLNATQAAIRAGYSERTARTKAAQLMALPHVQEAIQAATAARSERTEVTQDWVISNLVQVVERSLQRAPVFNARGKQVVDEEGRHVWRFDSAGANKALELLGKHVGMFGDKMKVEHSGLDGAPLVPVVNVSIAKS